MPQGGIALQPSRCASRACDVLGERDRRERSTHRFEQPQTVEAAERIGVEQDLAHDVRVSR